MIYYCFNPMATQTFTLAKEDGSVKNWCPLKVSTVQIEMGVNLTDLVPKGGVN